MRNKKILLLLALCACLALTGCRFAKEETAGRKDTPVGISLRLERVDGAEEGTVEQAAVIEQADEIDSFHTGAVLSAGIADGFGFERSLGDRYFYIDSRIDENGDEMRGFEQDGWPGNVHHHITVSDDGETYESDAVVYITGAPMTSQSDEDEYGVLCLDTIFRRDDGTLYAQTADGAMMGNIDGFSQEWKYESTVTDPSGETSSFTVRMKVTVKYIMELEKAWIAAFDTEGTLLKRDALDWRNAEEELLYTIPEGAAYLILEEEGVRMDGERGMARTLTNLPASNGALFTLYVSDGTGFADPLPVTVAK